MDMNDLLAGRTRRMEANAIREILKVASQPGMVSLAGGIPAPESFPLKLMGLLTQAVLDRYGAAALQYDQTEGFGPLREALAPLLGESGISATADTVLIASGSQGVLDGLGKVLIGKGDAIAVESPTYLGAISAFNPYEPRYLCMESDEDGLIPESLQAVLERERPKFIYLVPTFQNPTGRTIPMDRRLAIARMIQDYQVLLIEDDPYSALRYSGEPLAPIQTLAPGNVVYVSTLSKVFAPGLRVGFCVAPPLIRQWLVKVKQGTDLHTSTFNQALAAEYIMGGHLGRQLPRIRDIYAPKQRAMLSALERHFPPGYAWSKPEGGMFIWVRGPEGMDMDPIYDQAVARKTAFVPGRYFFPNNGDGRETMRLNFTMNDPDTIGRAVAVLGEIIRGAHDPNALDLDVCPDYSLRERQISSGFALTLPGFSS